MGKKCIRDVDHSEEVGVKLREIFFGSVLLDGSALQEASIVDEIVYLPADQVLSAVDAARSYRTHNRDTASLANALSSSVEDVTSSFNAFDPFSSKPPSVSRRRAVAITRKPADNAATMTSVVRRLGCREGSPRASSRPKPVEHPVMSITAGFVLIVVQVEGRK